MNHYEIVATIGLMIQIPAFIVWVLAITDII
jgi:hypothetical protein